MSLSRYRNLQNRRHFIITLIRKSCQDFLKNKPIVDSNFAFIDPVSAVYYGGGGGGSGWLRVYQNDYVIDNYVEPAVI